MQIKFKFKEFEIFLWKKNAWTRILAQTIVKLFRNFEHIFLEFGVIKDVQKAPALKFSKTYSFIRKLLISLKINISKFP